MKINGLHHRTIWPDSNDPTHIQIIDQRHLPHHLVIEPLQTVAEAARAIRDMHVRGAGLIGATAGFGMYLAAIAPGNETVNERLKQGGELLCASRPTARNLAWAVERVLAETQNIPGEEDKKKIAFTVACAIADEDAQFCRRLGEHGREIIRAISEKKDGAPVNVLTHCNAGWLAFVDWGSATAPIYAARDAGIAVHVWVDETRPWNQGAKLTAWELQQEGIECTLITDNTGGHLMQKGMVDLVIVGTDRTTRTGDVANKIGTYLKALAAHENGVPFYVALPSSTIDWTIGDGVAEIPIEARSAEEVTHIQGRAPDGAITTVQLTPTGSAGFNPAFDVTPSRLVTGLITERGVAAATEAGLQELYGND